MYHRNVCFVKWEQKSDNYAEYGVDVLRTDLGDIKKSRGYTKKCATLAFKMFDFL